MNERIDTDDFPHKEWNCAHCSANNSHLDSECQFCDENSAADIEQEVYCIADEILTRLGTQSNGDPYVAVAALAVAMCSLARAGDIPIAEVKEALSIATKQVNALDH